MSAENEEMTTDEPQKEPEADRAPELETEPATPESETPEAAPEASEVETESVVVEE
jgi:hypothetical protein